MSPSDIGAYHRLEGFREFSCHNAVHSQLKTTRPPCGEGIRKSTAGALSR